MPILIRPDGATYLRPVQKGRGLRLYGSSTGSVGLLPQANAGSVDYTLPNALPASPGLLTTDVSGNLTWTLDNLYAKLAANNIFTASGGLSSGVGPAVKYSGSPVTGGSTSTTLPMFVLGNGTNATNYSVNGTYLSLNTDSGFTGIPLEVRNNGSQVLSLSIGGSLTLSGSAVVGAGNLFSWSSRSRLTSPSDGVILAQNAAATGFTRFILGASDTSNVSLKNSGSAVLGVRTGSDSADAGLTCGTIVASGSVTFSAAGAASTPGLLVSGAPYTGGTSTTNYPQVFINNGVSGTWNSLGTIFGLLPAASFTGVIIDIRGPAGSSVLSIDSANSTCVVQALSAIGGISGNSATLARNGGSSASAITLTGGVGTGTATTCLPQVFFQPSGTTAVTTWSTSGTALGFNLASGMVGNVIDVHVGGGSSVFAVSYVGNVSCGSVSITGPLRRTVSAASDATSWTPNSDASNLSSQTNTQTAGTLTVNAPSGTPVDGQLLELRLKSTNAQTFSFNAIYRASTDLALPTTSSAASKWDYLLFQYNSADTKWDIIAKHFGH